MARTGVTGGAEPGERGSSLSAGLRNAEGDTEEDGETDDEDTGNPGITRNAATSQEGRGSHSCIRSSRLRKGSAYEGCTRCGSNQFGSSVSRACEDCAQEVLCTAAVKSKAAPRRKDSDEEFVEDEQVALLFDEGHDGVNIDEWKMGMETDKDL
ncbi:hypothetical protein NDU88_009694 [Pleurodeles waltl]|uniref:Uncharacterized protein n=1 Tax=Pleurodeles waltl TaxID=8319 RepID=A0AAV7PVZ9_PLEWA|nr:hypothetical protein NDU88_009694 [Pleurodeles waltl]